MGRQGWEWEEGCYGQGEGKGGQEERSLEDSGGGQRRESALWPGAGREGFLEEVGIGPKGVDLARDSEHNCK